MKDITSCAYENCTNIDYLRHYSNAPKNNNYVSSFAVKPKENGKCDYMLRKGE